MKFNMYKTSKEYWAVDWTTDRFELLKSFGTFEEAEVYVQSLEAGYLETDYSIIKRPTHIPHKYGGLMV